MVKECLYELIKKTVLSLFPKIKIPHFDIDEPKSKQWGDLSTNIAFLLSKQLDKTSKELAKKIILNLPKIDMFEKVESVGGFINFYLNPHWLFSELKKILKEKENYGKANIGKGKRVIVEFISANPTGPLTLGNGRGGFYGDVLSNLLEKVGYKVIREYYVNDAGNQIKVLGQSILSAKLNNGGRNEEGQNLYKGTYIKELAKVVSGDDPEDVGKKAAKIILEKIIKNELKKLKIRFNNFVSEQDFLKSGKTEKVINELENRGLTYRKEGALWFQSTKFGDDQDRVLIRKDGQPTYFATDIAYHLDKCKRADLLVNFWGTDHHGYVPRILAALSAFGLEKKLHLIIVQLVRLIKEGKEVRMSKRAGVYFTLLDLVKEVGLDVARYFFISVAPETHMDFDLQLAKERSLKNPVYYIQYASARIFGIFKKFKQPVEKIPVSTKNLSLLKEPAEVDLIKQLVKYPDIINEIAHNHQVHKIPQYAFNLATAFHNFYEKCQVLTADNQLTLARLNLVLATKYILLDILHLMGINAPERM